MKLQVEAADFPTLGVWMRCFSVQQRQEGVAPQVAGSAVRVCRGNRFVLTITGSVTFKRLLFTVPVVADGAELSQFVVADPRHVLLQAGRGGQVFQVRWVCRETCTHCFSRAVQTCHLTLQEAVGPPYCPARGADSDRKVSTLCLGVLERTARQIRPPVIPRSRQEVQIRPSD